MKISQQRSGTPLLRLGHPMAFSAFLRHIGSPVERYLRSQRMPVLCDDPSMFVPLARAWAFFDTAARHEDMMLGWLVGAHASHHNLNAGLLRKLETASSLHQALQGLVQMANSEATHLQLGIDVRRDDVLLYTQYAGKRDDPGYRQSQAYQILVILDLIRHFLGTDWVPDEIGVEHSIAPAIAEKLFPGCRILTHQPRGYIVVPRIRLPQTAQHTIPTSAAGHDMEMVESFDYKDTLRQVLSSYLSDGYPTAQFVAELMGTSERTLARRLSTCGLTYRALVDDVRFTEAKKLLLNPAARIEDVAIAIGFKDQTNFTRMFRRVGGLSPREFRRAHTPLNRS